MEGPPAGLSFHYGVIRQLIVRHYDCPSPFLPLSNPVLYAWRIRDVVGAACSRGTASLNGRFESRIKKEDEECRTVAMSQGLSAASGCDR